MNESTMTTEEILEKHPRWSYVRTDRNGTRYFYDYTCDRCGGAGGSQAWIYTGYTCYKCGGTGKMDKPDVIKVYTLEHEAKLVEQRAKRAAQREKERLAKMDAEYDERMVKAGFGKEGEEFVIYRVKGETFSIKEELKALGCKFKPQVGWYCAHDLEGYETQRMTSSMVLCSERPYIDWKNKDECEAQFNDETTGSWVGEVGSRIQIRVKVTKVVQGNGYTYAKGPWGSTSSYLILMKDEDGNEYKWSTSCYYGEGEEVEFRATVKAHETYRNKRQTVLTRCTKVKEAS